MPGGPSAPQVHQPMALTPGNQHPAKSYARTRRSERSARRYRPLRWRCRSGYSARHPPIMRRRSLILLTVCDAGAGWSWPNRYGGASRLGKSIVPPGCWAGGPGASACVRAAGLARRMSARFARAGQRSQVRRHLQPDPVVPFCDCVPAAQAPQRAIPGRRRLVCPAGNGTAVSAAGLRRDDLAGWEPGAGAGGAIPGRGDRNYAVASSSAPVRSARISPMVCSRLPVWGSGSWAWIWWRLRRPSLCLACIRPR